jgi:hypothetical protein
MRRKNTHFKNLLRTTCKRAKPYPQTKTRAKKFCHHSTSKIKNCKFPKKPYFCTVKYFTLILSFYIFAMVAMPCGDKDDCQNQDTELSALADNDHSDHEGDTENCSPFCICACCGHSVTAPDFFASLTSLVQYPTKNLSIYTASFVSGAFSKIWQPPKSA